MGPDLWELFEYGKEDDEVAAIIRLAHHSAMPKGVRVVTQFGEIVTVRLRRGDLLTVSGASEVVSMAAGDTYHGPDVELEMDSELSSDTVLPTDERRAKDISASGKGVVVGVVDWGFDFAHPDFRKEDGTSRIVALWDQRGGKQPNSPGPFGYGIVHSRETINKALRDKNPYKAIGYHPADADTGIGSHGTHVASIAAGTGGSDRPGGVAHEADIVLVHNAPWDELESGKLGDSVTLLEAIDYISRTAGDRPWVINLSMGRHGEQHDGSTLIEQGLDAALRTSPGRAVCMSAGNYFNKHVHASGQLRPTQKRTFVWQINEGHPSDYNQLEIWYSWQDKFECSVRSPDGSIAATVNVGERAKLKVSGSEVGNVYHRAQEPNNLDNHITIYLYKEAPAGDWEVSIVGSDVIDGRFHAWIEREVACPKCQSHFRAEDADPHTTTGTICNGRRTIAVGAYDAHDAEMRLGPFSSVGPTRDARLKPDLCAPGVSVLAARSAPREGSAGLLTRMSGTSMAAPHVTGTVALMFQAAPRRLRIEETHNLLLQNARRVSIPEEIPDRIGIGFLDVDEAVEAARNVARGTPSFKEIVPTSAPSKAKVVPAGKESTEQEVAVEAESQEGFPAKELVEAAVLQAAIDMQSVPPEASESETVSPREACSEGCSHASAPPSAASECASIHGVESMRIPDERVRVGTGTSESESILEGESIGIAAESVRHASVKPDVESTPEIEAIGVPAERAPRASAGITEAETESSVTHTVATMELEAEQEASEAFVEVADQIVREGSGRLSAVDLLRATLIQTACSPWATSGDRFPTAAEIFDAFAYWRSSAREQLNRCFEVVGLPGSVLQNELRRSDVLVRRGDGDMGHVAIIASPQLKTLETVLAEGLIPETFSAGLYAQVIETGVWPHELSDKFARLITEPNGRIPYRQLILRPRLSSFTLQTQPTGNGGGRSQQQAEQNMRAAAGMDAEGVRRFIDDLLLLRLATPTPPTVVTVTPPASAASAQLTITEESEAEFAESAGPDETVTDTFAAVEFLDIGKDEWVNLKHFRDPISFGGAFTESEVLDSAAFPSFALTDLKTLDLVRAVSKPKAGQPNYEFKVKARIYYPRGSKDKQVAGKRKYPVVVIIHGNHGWIDAGAEINSYLGYEYLQKELAAHGIISMSIDTNAANALESNVRTRSEFVQTGLRILKRLNETAGHRLKDRLDLQNVGLMGHSRGGDAVVKAALMNRGNAAASIKVVCSLAPTDATGFAAPSDRLAFQATDKLKYFVLYGSHDGDVSGEGGMTGFRHYDRALCDRALAFVKGIKHDRFNTKWNNLPGYADPSDCASSDPAWRSDAEHQQLAIEYIGGLFRLELNHENSLAGLFDGSAAPSGGHTISMEWSPPRSPRKTVTVLHGTSLPASTKWTKGWTTLLPFQLPGNRLPCELAYKKDTGDVTIDLVDPATGATTIYSDQWRKGWTNFVLFEMPGDKHPYDFGYMGATGEVAIDRIALDGKTVDVDIWKGKWTLGWTSMILVRLPSDPLPCVLSYKKDSGIASIDRIKAIGNGTDNLYYDTGWTKGWTSFIPIRLPGNDRQCYLAYKKDSGDVTIDQVEANGTGVTTIWNDTWTKGWTSFIPFRLPGDDRIYYLAHKKDEGDIAVDRINRDGKGVETLVREKWSKQWTHFMSFVVDYKPHYLAYKVDAGDVAIGRLLPDWVLEVDDFESSNPARNLLGGAVALSGASRRQFDAGSPGTPDSIPHQTQVLQANGAGARYRADIPPSNADFTGFTALLCRLASEFKLNSQGDINSGTLPDFKFRVFYSKSGAVQSAEANQGALDTMGARSRQKPFFREICPWVETSPGHFVQIGPVNQTKIAMQACILPFAAFGGVNWGDVRAIEFETGATVSGKVFFDSLAVV